MLSPIEQRKFLNDLIVVRHAELARFVTILSRESEKVGRLSNRMKIATIILGAFSASQGVAAEAYGKASPFTSILFALIGIAVAAIAGIEVALKFETRASELRVLAAKCQAARFQHNSEWAHKIAIAKPGEAIAAARDLLAIQDQALSEAQLEAAKLGVNIVMEENRKLRDPANAEAVFDAPGGLGGDPPTVWVSDDLPRALNDLPDFPPADDHLPPPSRPIKRRRPSEKG